jgi:hypothetical protein
MGIFDDADFTIKERAERNLPLPEILKAKEIAGLWSDNKRQQEVILGQIKKAIEIYSLNIQPHKIYSSETKSLKTLPNFLKVYEDGEDIYVRWSDSKDEWVYEEESAKISKQDFVAWFENEKTPLPTACLLQNWWCEIRPEIESQMNDDKTGQKKSRPKERELTRWMYDVWITEGKPGGTEFFTILKKYLNKDKSPITEHYTTSPKGAQIKWHTGTASKYMSKKTIQSKVSKFRNKTQ